MPKKPKRGQPTLQPPPLPEFYLPHRLDLQSVHEVTAKSKQAQAEYMTFPLRAYGAINVRPEMVNTTDYASSDGSSDTNESGMKSQRQAGTGPWRQPKAQPSIPPGCSDMFPMAIYHICRVCNRPRSPKFHEENPIPFNGVPPPPGICRRCRIAPVEEIAKVADVVTKCESKDVRLGVKCSVPDADVFSPTEVKVLREHSREKSDQRSEGKRQTVTRRDLRYRHVEVQVIPSPSGNSSNQRQHAAKPVLLVRSDEASDRKTPEALSSSDHQFHSWTDQDIRRIARDECVRYRQAERKLQAHPDPFAHGRLIPVETQAQKQRMKSEGASWMQSQPQRIELPQHERKAEASREKEYETPAKEEWPQRSSTVDGFSRPSSIHEKSQNQPVRSPRDPPADSKYLPWAKEQPDAASRADDHPIRIKLREVVGIAKQTNTCHYQSGIKELASDDDEEFQAYSRNHARRVKHQDSERHVASPPPKPTSQRTITSKRQPPKSQEDALPGRIRELKEGFDRQERLHEQNPPPKQLIDKHARGQSTKWAKEERILYDNLTDDDRRENQTKHVSHVASRNQRKSRHESQDNKSASVTTHPETVLGYASGNEMGDNHQQRSSAAGGIGWDRDHRDAAKARSSERTLSAYSPPYPNERESDLIPMPSPSVQSVRHTEGDSVRNPLEGTPTNDYFYMERTTQPVDSKGHVNSRTDEPSNYYLEKEELFVRGRQPELSSKRPHIPRDLREQAFIANSGLSHVAFSKKVDVSPTPPRSDASSDQFRDFSERLRRRTYARPNSRAVHRSDTGDEPNQQSRAQDQDYMRKRRTTPPAHHQQTSQHAPQRQYARTQGSNSARSERIDPHTPTARLRDQHPLTQALSESPSREDLRKSRAPPQARGVGPPYRREETPSASLVAEYGSDEEWEMTEREHDRRRRLPYGHRSRY